MQARQMLQDIKDSQKVSYTKIAKQMGVCQSTVHRIATGRTKHCHADTYLAILDFYNKQKTPSDN